ncbi:MAG: Zn-ribbon domain-containing OB-fold protein [Candidatus Syntropharchaeia archaeon]
MEVEKLTFKKFFDALKEGKLIGYRCKDCGEYTCPPQSTCQECGSDNLEVAELKTRGEIKTFTTIFVAPAGLENEAPYIVCDVETEDGPWIIGRLDYDPEKADQELIGRKVRIGYRELPAEKFYPDKERRIVPFFELEE